MIDLLSHEKGKGRRAVITPGAELNQEEGRRAGGSVRKVRVDDGQSRERRRRGM